MHRPTTVAMFSAVAFAGLFTSSVHGTVQGKCIARKISCVSRKVTDLVECHRRAETPGKPADPNASGCLDAVRARFDGASDPSEGCFARVEENPRNHCITFGDTAAAEVAVDSCVDRIVAAIDPGAIDQSACNARKKKCVARKLRSLLHCYGKAATPGKPPDENAGGCVDKAKAWFDGGPDPAKGCFAKAEKKPANDCLPPIGNQAVLESLIDGSSCIGAFVALLEPSPSTTTTATTVTTTSTTTSTLVPSAYLDFTIRTPGGICGETRDGSGAVLDELACGVLYMGSGVSLFGEAPFGAGSTSRFFLGCAGSSCSVGPTAVAPPPNSTAPDCTHTGCTFGTPLPMPNPVIPSITTCMLISWSAPAAGALDLASGAMTAGMPLASDVYITSNLSQPCPRCSAAGTPSAPATGVCDRGPRAGLACVTRNQDGLTRDCPTGGVGPSKPCTLGGGLCLDGIHVGPISLAVVPLTTGTATMSSPTGIFCPGQPDPGCFGRPTCRSITEAGSSAGPLTPDVPAEATLAATFCSAPAWSGAIDAAIGLPGPAAVSLPGTFTVSSLE